MIGISKAASYLKEKFQWFWREISTFKYDAWFQEQALQECNIEVFQDAVIKWDTSIKKSQKSKIRRIWEYLLIAK